MFGLSTSQWYRNGEVRVEENSQAIVQRIVGITTSNSQGLWLEFFSQKYSLTFVGNVGIYSVGTENVYQIGQSGKTKYFAGVSREGLTRKLLTKHSFLHPVPTLCIPVMCRAYASFCRMLSRQLLAKTL